MASGKKRTRDGRAPFVSIVLVNFNGWKETLECLESVLRNGYPAYQVVVCDNGSTDGSLKKIRDWAEGKIPRLPPADKKMSRYSVPPVRKPVRYEFHPHEKGRTPVFKKSSKLVILDTGGNLGFAGGNNAGIRGAFSYSDYVWLLNNDTVMENNSLSEMVRLAESDKTIGVVGSRLLYYSDPGTIQNFGNRKIGWTGIGDSYLANREDGPLDDADVRSVIGASLLIKKEVIRKIGLMDESYFMQDEETDWCVRSSAAGYRVCSCAASRIYHKEGKSSDRTRQERKFLLRKSRRVGTGSYLISGYYSVRNEIHFVRRNFQGKFVFYLVFILPYKLTRLVMGILLFRDDRMFLRVRMVLRGAMDGIAGRMGMTIDPAAWKLSMNEVKGKKP
jgi:GT2 family glycosyltransferase